VIGRASLEKGVSLQLVILAAGCGVRLGDEAQDKPKSLVLIRDRAYLSYQLEAFRKFSFSQSLIVGGFGIEHLRNFLHSEKSNLTLVENPEYQKGNLYSLAAARPLLTDDFFIFNADHYYSDATYAKIFATHSEHVTAFCDFDRKLHDDDMKVHTQEKIGVLGVKNMAKTLSVFECGYVGVTYVPRVQAENYWQAFEAVAKSLGDKANVEHVLQRLADDGAFLPIQDVSGSWWTEIDTVEDLQKARETIPAK
jgi:choline kinase